MGSLVFPGKGLGWPGGVVPPSIAPFPLPSCPAAGMVYQPPPAYPGVPSPASVRQHPQAGGTALGAWKRIGEEERRLREREARLLEAAARVAEGWTEGQGMPRGGEAQAVEELQRAWTDLPRTLERVERTEREGGRHRELAQKSGGSEGRPPLQPFRQPAISPGQGRQMQERAWRQIRAEAARLAERDKEVAARERRVREGEEAVARGFEV